MKTKALIFALLATASTMTSAFGNDGPGMTVVSQKGSEVFKVIYKGTTAGKVKLNVLNSQGKMIHSESIAGLNGFICPLNFKGLESGDYMIELVDGEGTHREKVSYRTVYEMKSIHVTRLKGLDGKYLLAVSNAQNEPINVNIYDESRNLVYTESKVIKGDFAQVYKIESAFKNCIFEVSDAAGNKKYFNF